jgi:predicted GNAT family acetyltransferase/glutaredoxin
LPPGDRDQQGLNVQPEASAGLVTLYQAEWCPFSSAVREVLTELGIDAVIRQVEPWPDQRDRLRELAGTNQIPVLQTEDGRIFRGTRAIFAHLEEREPWRFAAAHRRRFEDHRAARESDVPSQLLEYFKGSGDLEALAPPTEPDEATVVDVPREHRYELLLDGRRIGLLAYHRRKNRIALTHTEVTPACEGRGFGSRLAAAALDDAREQGLAVVPLCPFIAGYIDRHPEYRDLVAPERRGHRDDPEPAT